MKMQTLCFISPDTDSSKVSLHTW